MSKKIIDYTILVRREFGDSYKVYKIREWNDEEHDFTLFNSKYKPIKIWDENNVLINKDVFLFLDRIVCSNPNWFRDIEEEGQIRLFCVYLTNKLKENKDHEIMIDNYKYSLSGEHIHYL